MDPPGGPSESPINYRLSVIRNYFLIVQRRIMPCCHGSVSAARSSPWRIRPEADNLLRSGYAIGVLRLAASESVSLTPLIPLIPDLIRRTYAHY